MRVLENIHQSLACASGLSSALKIDHDTVCESRGVWITALHGLRVGESVRARARHIGALVINPHFLFDPLLLLEFQRPLPLDFSDTPWGRWRVHAERQPLRFIDRELFPHMVKSLKMLAAHMDCDPKDLALVPNATLSLNAIFQSVQLSRLAPHAPFSIPAMYFLENRKLNLLHLLYFKLQNHASFMLFSPQLRQHILLGLHLQQRQEDDQSSMRKDWSHSRAEGPEVSSTYVFFPYLVNTLLETLCAPTRTTKSTETEKQKRLFQESTKHTVQSHQSSCSANFVCPPDAHTCSCGPRERDHCRACRGRAAVRLQASSL